MHTMCARQVFFVRDGIKFPDMVHALKPNPKNHIQENWRIADFFSHHPESMHMVRFACRLHGHQQKPLFGYVFGCLWKGADFLDFLAAGLVGRDCCVGLAFVGALTAVGRI